MKTRLSIIAALVAAVFTTAAALAVAPDSPPPPGGPHGPGQKMMERAEKDPAFREKIKERVFAMMSWELSDELELPGETEALFLKEFKTHFEERHALAEQHHQAMSRIAEINQSSAGIDQKKIKEALDVLETNRKKMLESEEKFFARVKEILTPEQQANFAVAWPNAQRNLIEKVRGERNRRMMGDENTPPEKGKLKKGSKDGASQK
jgi:Spy/CpxP family protein refolding chaperone